MPSFGLRSASQDSGFKIIISEIPTSLAPTNQVNPRDRKLQAENRALPSSSFGCLRVHSNLNVAKS